MNRFQTLFASNTKAFIPFFTLGDPAFDTSLDTLKAVIDAGADALELGFPFSDPIADGPTNQRSMQRALKAGMNFDRCLELLHRIRRYAPELPIGLLLYYNLLFRRGLEKAHAELAEAGVDGIVSADLPLEEAEEHMASLNKHHIGAIQMIAPNTTDERAQSLFEHSSAFSYVLSSFGTTGVKKHLAPGAVERIQHLRALTTKPLVVGFGLSTPEHVQSVWEAGAEGAIVGSRFTNIIETHSAATAQARAEIVQFVKDVVALKGQ